MYEFESIFTAFFMIGTGNKLPLLQKTSCNVLCFSNAFIEEKS